MEKMKEHMRKASQAIYEAKEVIKRTLEERKTG